MKLNEIIVEAANPAQQAAIAIAKKKEAGVSESSQRVDSLVTDALKLMRGGELTDAIQALKTVLGDREFSSRRGHYNFYVRQLMDMYSQQGVAEGNLEEYGDTARGQKMLAKVHHRAADRVTSKQADKDPAYARKAQQTQDRAWERLAVKEQGVTEGETWSKHNNPRAGGMSKKSVSSYRRSHPGSKIQTAVTTKPSKIKKGSKDSKRRASFCARMRGMKKHNTSAKTKNDPDSNINKSLRRWHCESIEQMEQLVMLAEQKIRNLKK